MILAIWYETAAIAVLAGFMLCAVMAWLIQRNEDKENKDGNDN